MVTNNSLLISSKAFENLTKTRDVLKPRSKDDNMSSDIIDVVVTYPKHGLSPGSVSNRRNSERNGNDLESSPEY